MLAWGSLDGPVDQLLTQAAFHVVEHPPHPPGAASFDAFVADLAAASDYDEREQVSSPLAHKDPVS